MNDIEVKKILDDFDIINLNMIERSLYDILKKDGYPKYVCLLKLMKGNELSKSLSFLNDKCNTIM